ncbi:hypothetical protein M2189_005823 [Bradyrhizobium japonicum]|nr:hypothetical protein [Bradyrhizobium japonicum]
MFDPRDDFSDRVIKLQGPFRWNDALRRSQEQRVVQNKAQPAKRVADSGRRQVQSRGCARDMAFFQDHAEEHKEIQFDPG